MRPDELVQRMRPHLHRALVALDFDGTLAPIVVDPATSRPAPGALDALVRLSGRGATIAVITGRDARTVVELGSLDAVPGLVVAGLYGAETWTAGDLRTMPTPDSLTRLRAELPQVVAQQSVDDAVWVEDKRLSLVVHARAAADPPAALAALRPGVAALAARLGLEVHDGRGVMEVRLPGFDKGVVLRGLVAERDPAAVLFAGDDLGDLPAFDAVRELRASGRAAWSVASGSAEVDGLADAADVHVAGPDGLVATLTELAAPPG